MTREEASKILYHEWQAFLEKYVDYGGVSEAYKMAIKALEEQEPKTGHWIIIDDCEQFIAKCSECGRIEDSRMIHKYPYCHCGAKMESEGEE